MVDAGVQIPLDALEGLADRRRRQPPAKRPTRKGLQVRPLFLPLESRERSFDLWWFLTLNLFRISDFELRVFFP